MIDLQGEWSVGGGGGFVGGRRARAKDLRKRHRKGICIISKDNVLSPLVI